MFTVKRQKDKQSIDNITLWNFARNFEMKPVYFVVPLVCSLGAALCDGLSVGLLIPLIDGILSGNFEAAIYTPIIGNILAICPSSMISSFQKIFILIVLVVFTAAFLNHLMRYAAIIATSFLVRRSANTLRKKVFNKYLNQGKIFFDKTSFGHLGVVLQGFTQRVAASIIQLTSYVTTLFVIIVYLSMMFFLSWRITVCVLLVVPLLNWIFKGLIVKIKLSSQMQTEKTKELTKKGFDILTCIPLVKMEALQEREKQEYGDVSNAMEKVQFSMDKKTQLLDPLQRMLMLIVLVIAIGILAAATSQKGIIEVSRMLVYFYLLREVSVKMGLFNQIKGIEASIAAPMKDISEIINMTDQDEVKGGESRFSGIFKSLDIKNLKFSYTTQREILKNITFNIPKGQMTAIVGPTGAGKTTIISLLLRFYDCPPGTILIDGKDIRDFKIDSLMAKMALVSQETYLFNDTLRNNVIYGKENIPEDTIEEAIKKARLYDYVKTLPEGINTIIGDRGVRLSGGEKQRVSIARAILKKAEILILDEATSALDTRTEQLVHEAIEEAVKDKTTIVIAHRLSTIRNVDKIVVIEDGAFIEEGTLQELLDKKGRFYQYWQAQKFY